MAEIGNRYCSRHAFFQQDRSACCTSNETIDILLEKYPDRVISRKFDHNNPPRACDLTASDFLP